MDDIVPKVGDALRKHYLEPGLVLWSAFERDGDQLQELTGLERYAGAIEMVENVQQPPPFLRRES